VGTIIVWADIPVERLDRASKFYYTEVNRIGLHQPSAGM
jgi:hypothetical protein